jgi:hypothetical protein
MMVSAYLYGCCMRGCKSNTDIWGVGIIHTYPTPLVLIKLISPNTENAKVKTSGGVHMAQALPKLFTLCK